MLSATFDDFDEFAATVRDADLEMMVQRIVRPSWSIRHLEGAGIHVQHGLEGSGDITRGQARADGWVVFLPLRNREAQRGNGRILDAASLLVLEPGCEFQLAATHDHEWCSVFLPTARMARAAEAEACRRGVGRVVRTTPETVDAFRGLALRILSAAERSPAAASAGALDPLLGTLGRAAEEVILGPDEAGRPSLGRPRIPRGEIVRRAIRVFDSSGGRSSTARDVARTCGVSERTLRSVFRETFGVTPLQYRQLRGLHRVRRALREGPPESTSVSEVLLRFGEWEFGRFAQRYRAAFGELPSETLASAGRRGARAARPAAR